MRYAIAALLAVSFSASAADLVATQGNDSVRLTDKPCTIIDAVVAKVPQGMRGHLRHAETVFQGKNFTACWAEYEGGAFLWYEDGDMGAIPTKDLKPAVDI